MRLQSFQIKNFRSIKDSGKCYLASDVTILAGRNESGKTNIVEALNKFKKEEKLSNLDYPSYEADKKQIEILFSFRISAAEINEIVKKLEINLKLSKEKEYTIDILRTDKENKYIFCGELLEILKKELQRLNEEIISGANEKIAKLYELLNTYKVEIPEKKRLLIRDSYDEIVNKVNGLINIIDQSTEKITNEKNKNSLKEIKDEVVSVKSKINIDSNIDKIERGIAQRIPKVILFSSFDDILPYETELDQANQKIIKNFCKISGLNIDSLRRTSDTQERKSIVDEASAIIDGNFKSFWKQDEVRLKVDIDGSKLIFLVYDEGKYVPFRPQQRSKGLQWFLSFYITLSAEGQDKGVIILIDEPGLYLHAKAQEDVLSVLEKLSEINQIIFTTHMPYLINPNRLDRIRLIIKNNKGETKIENNIQKGADKETLTPIITAIGLDLSKGINIAKDKNVLLEGISDYYYVQAILEYLRVKNNYKFPHDIHFIPSVGADKFSLLLPLLTGWGLSYLVLLDHDEKGIKVAKKLRETYLLGENNILFVDESKNFCMEDLFSKKDFIRYVIGKEDKKTDIRNSELIKKQIKSKALISKLFFDKMGKDIDKIEFLEESIKKFQKLFDNIRKVFIKSD